MLKNQHAGERKARQIVGTVPSLPVARLPRHGTPNFWHRADDFKARHSQFSTSERIGTKCNVAPVLKILGMPRLPPGGSSLFQAFR